MKENECVECGFELKGESKEIGIIAETGEYTLNDKKATQGFFPIGICCFRKVKNKLIEKPKRKEGEKKMKREQIIKKAHLEESSDLARSYFNQCGLRVEIVTLKDCEKLSEFIQKRMDELLSDKTYQMIKDLRMKKKIEIIKNGIFLYASGSYFKKRQAVSFEYDRRDGYKFIGFCAWASGCNRIPFIEGFVNWCDWMVNKQKQKEVKS